jgi:hypothetical protein
MLRAVWKLQIAGVVTAASWRELLAAEKATEQLE